jgi:N-dimethylarginine dimethylaminohydrolase
VTTQFDEYQRALHEKRWTWDDIPFYHGPGGRQTVSEFHDLDYLDVYERVYGRRAGANGIGRLREVALPEEERFAGYAELLEAEGVAVRRLEGVDAAWPGQDLLVLNGGAVVPKPGDPAAFGRGEELSRWAFWNLNVPTLLTIHGSGVCEAGATVWLAQDVFVVGDSPAYDEEGRRQLLDVVRLTAGLDDVKVLTIRCQGEGYFDRETGAAAHVTNLVAPLDLHTVLAYPPGIDAGTLIWLERNGYTVVEATREDQTGSNVCNLTILEPGRVVMPADAGETVARVRAAGVEVVEAPCSNLHAATLQLYREPGPARFA